MVLKLILFIFLGVNLAHGQELKTITAEKFLAENPSPEREAIVNFIIHQFDDKREAGVTQAQLDTVWANKEERIPLGMARFQIVNQKLYADSFRILHTYFKVLLNYFEQLIKIYKIEDVDFIVYVHDEIPLINEIGKKTLAVPSFMMSKNMDSPYEKDKLLLPDAYMIQDKWQKLITEVELANFSNSWSDKIDKIFWRGAASGRATTPYDIKNLDNLPRLNLVMLSKLYPDLIDANFTAYEQIAKDKDGRALKKAFTILFGEKIQESRPIDHLKYKYLISIDGNTCSWLRVPWIMLSNSILVKQETNKMEWFYSSLKPYVNYVPVNERLTDILPQLEWMKNHDKELQHIANNAHNFVKNNLMPKHIDAHMVIILNEYHKLQKDEQIIATLTPFEDIYSMSASLELLWSWLINNSIWWVKSWF